MFDSRMLYRIRAVRDFGNVKAGDLGGYVETKSNLWNDYDSWIYDDAKVYGISTVHDWGKVSEDAVVKDSTVRGNAKVFGTANVDGSSIHNWANVYGNAKIKDSQIYECAEVFDDAEVTHSKVNRHAKVFGKSSLRNCIVSNILKDKIVTQKCKDHFKPKQYNDDFHEARTINYSGVNENGEHIIKVDCQLHPISKWKDEDFRNNLISKHNFDISKVPEFLKILEEIENEISI